ncbi:MAG: hypothetical protein WKG32_23185 [Gemmatimonadaceae bacterium]
MLINLVPDFFTVLNSTDRVAAYVRYFAAHRRILEPYWESYVLPGDTLGSDQFLDVVRTTVSADRDDLRAMLARVDAGALVRAAAERTATLLAHDAELDVVLMVGVGAANAGELVTQGKGIAFICLEHFTAVANPTTQGLGLDPELMPLWVAHEVAHAVRYTSPESRSEMRRLVDEAAGEYSYWETGRRASLRELLVNEGLAVEVARAVSPGHAEWEYFGYGRRQYARIRELGFVLAHAVADDLDASGLGLRLRYLSGGVSDDARTVDGHVLPERAGYYLGARLAAPAIARHGAAWAVRASADEIIAAGTGTPGYPLDGLPTPAGAAS